jgi:anti-sigma B factor antagonist
MANETPADFAVHAERAGHAYVVAPVGELDLGTVDEVRAAIEARPPDTELLVLDLRGLTFFDTSGMRLVVQTVELADAAGLDFALIRGSQAIQRLFALARMEDRLPFLDDPRDAFRA